MKILTALLFCASVAAAADLPSAESVLQKSVERSGGKAYTQIKSLQMEGTVELAGHNISGPVSIVQTGKKSYTVIEFPGLGKVEEGFDGTVAWETNAIQGARIKEGEEKAAVERAERLTMLNSWHDYYTSARTVGTEELAGKPAWKIELTPKTGKPEFYFFDKDSGLLAGITQTVTTALGDITVSSTVGDYRAVDGVQTPFSMVQNAMGQVMNMHFTSVKYNVEIPDEKFALPAAVKAILEKRKTPAP